MPSISVYKRYLNSQDNGGNTVGRFLKEHADFVMEETWDNDIQSKRAYIYDYYHDDQPELNRGMTYENTTKTPIDVKFIINEYGSAAKDSPTAKIMFKPSQKVEFKEGDDLYYYQTDFVEKYGAKFPIGLFIDLPDERGIYNKWLIVLADIQGNQFPKYFVLPCTYKLQWIRREGNKRIKQQMWSVVRNQNSYNSGSSRFLRVWKLHVVTPRIAGIPLESYGLQHRCEI